MAVTITRRDMNQVGNLWEDVFEISTEASAGDDDATVYTRLHWIENVDVTCRDGEDLGTTRWNLNSTTNSETENDPGVLYAAGLNAGDTATTYYCRALGW